MAVRLGGERMVGVSVEESWTIVATLTVHLGEWMGGVGSRECVAT